jgi:DNA (cytosine-5)-methyltransferase 1
MTDKNTDDLPTVSGAGGLSVGFEAEGFRALGGIDDDAQAAETWDLNHDGSGICGDITEYTPDRVMDELGVESGDTTAVVGGPPCQDFTKCNQKLDLGRRHLVTLYAEYVRSIRPDAFVMENVRQLASKYEDVLQTVYDALGEEYDIAHRLLDSADYGVPQHRIRAFVIGVQKDANTLEGEVRFPRPTHGPDSDGGPPIRTAGEALSDIDAPKNPEEYSILSKHESLLDDIPPGMNYSFYTEKLGHPNPEFGWRSRFSDFLYKSDPEKPVRTLKAQPGSASGPFHWDNRRFTEAELKALQSFSADFEMPDGYTTVVRQIGNSVPPRIAAALAQAVRQMLGLNSLDSNSLVEADEKLGFYSRKRTSSEEYQRKATQRLEKLGL